VKRIAHPDNKTRMPHTHTVAYVNMASKLRQISPTYIIAIISTLIIPGEYWMFNTLLP